MFFFWKRRRRRSFKLCGFDSMKSFKPSTSSRGSARPSLWGHSHSAKQLQQQRVPSCCCLMSSHHTHPATHAPVTALVLFFSTLPLEASWASHGLEQRRWKAPAGVPRSGRPVGLVEVDVEGLRPVGKDGLLRDEAVVAALTPPLVGQIQGALVRSGGLVVVIRHEGMGGRSARGGGGGGD